MGIRIKGLARDPGMTALYYSVLLKWQNSEWRFQKLRFRLQFVGSFLRALSNVDWNIRTSFMFLYLFCRCLTVKECFCYFYICVWFVLSRNSFRRNDSTYCSNNFQKTNIVLTSLYLIFYLDYFCHYFRENVCNLKRPQIRDEIFQSGSVSIETTPEAISVPITIPKSIKKTN